MTSLESPDPADNSPVGSQPCSGDTYPTTQPVANNIDVVQQNDNDQPNNQEVLKHGRKNLRKGNIILELPTISLASGRRHTLP